MFVFLSYPKEFEAVAMALDSGLKRREIHTFLDKKGINPGADWQHEIEANIKKAYVFVVLYSPEAATTSKFYLREIELIEAACEKSLQRIITVIFDHTKPSDLPKFFQRGLIIKSETTGVLEDKKDSYWIDQIVREVDHNLKRAKPRWQIISITALKFVALGSIVLISLLHFYNNALFFSGATIPSGIDLSTNNLFKDPPETNVPTNQEQEGYKVVLGADANLKLPGVPGELRVWIGSPYVDPKIPVDMVQSGTTLPAVGETAKITPFAPAFEIEPKESACMAIHPSGSVSRFKLIPSKIGTFNVGADVQLFNDPECRGAPIPKWTDTLQVTVVVNSDEAFQERTKQLEEIFWEKLKEFWGLLVALPFAFLLFLIRGRLKKWFSFGDDK